MQLILWNLHCADQYFFQKVSPVVFSGTQFTMGGIVLTLIGMGMGGHLGNITAGGVNHILSGNGFSSGIHTLVCTACME